MDNRKIKFRAWDKKENKFWTEYPIVINGAGTLLRFGIKDGLVMGSIVGCIQADYVIQQFTGLIDKNGKEIYEGDLVNFTTNSLGGDEDFISQEVHWAREDGGWAFGRWLNTRGETTYFTITGDWIKVKTLEIVGNIFENPELVTTL